MRSKKRHPLGKSKDKVPSRIWLLAFAVWGLILSGVFSERIGPPGMLQVIRLKNLLYTKRAQVSAIEESIASLKVEYRDFMENEVTQKREIRRTLGYAAADELIFDFTQTESLGFSRAQALRK